MIYKRQPIGVYPTIYIELQNKTGNINTNNKTKTHNELYYDYYGIWFRWIAGFLSNRRQYVVLNRKNVVGKMLREAFLKDQF